MDNEIYPKKAPEMSAMSEKQNPAEFAYYPVYLDIKGRNCLVVGGGSVGTRKVKGLLQSGAKVTVVSLEASQTITQLATKERIRLFRRGYRPDDLEGQFMVIGATDNEILNRQIYTDAERRHMLCNIADWPPGCNFILPAVIRRGDLAIAISTAGKSPAFARFLRLRLEKEYGMEYAVLLDLMGTIRKKLLAREHAPEEHKPLFEALIAGGLLDLIRENRSREIDALLIKILGDDFNLARLGFSTQPTGESK
jgi:precorrin-2 dehydrogenase/sirohydrochlorin ferrochelatase